MDELTFNSVRAFEPAGTLTSPLTASLASTIAPLPSRQVSFSELLGRQSGSGESGLDPTQRATAAAEQLVSVALVQPLLAQLRATNNAAPPFAPTGAEKQMRALQDADVARQITHAARFPLVDRLAQRMLNASRRPDPGAPQAE